MMSTVDSLLLVAGSALSEDIYRAVLKPKASQKERLKVARIGIFTVGVIPLLLIVSGIGEGELIQFIVVLFSALMAAGFFVPVVIGLWWRGATKQGAIASMIGGVAVTMLWKALGDPTIDPVLPGFAVALLLFFAVSKVTKPPGKEAIDQYLP